MSLPQVQREERLAIGATVHVTQVWAFGTIAGSYEDPRDGLVYVVDVMGFGRLCAIEKAVWPCPAAGERPACHLSAAVGRA